MPEEWAAVAKTGAIVVVAGDLHLSRGDDGYADSDSLSAVNLVLYAAAGLVAVGDYDWNAGPLAT
jgi:hypothetical protein